MTLNNGASLLAPYFFLLLLIALVSNPAKLKIHLKNNFKEFKQCSKRLGAQIDQQRLIDVFKKKNYLIHKLCVGNVSRQQALRYLTEMGSEIALETILFNF